LQVGNFSLNANLPVITKNKELDLATIKINHADHKDMIRQYSPNLGDGFISLIEKNTVKVGDKISFGGFPGMWKNRLHRDYLRFYSFSASFATINSVNENVIACQLDDLNSWPKISGAKESLEEPGGLSGGPAFLINTKSPIVQWSFLGIVTEGLFIDKTLIVYITLARCISPEGIINN
jgi:hypothetical protein